MSFAYKYEEKGVALITVMLILALATILAVSMSSRQQLDIHRSANVINFEQAYQYVLGAESWGKQILIRDSKNNQTDSFNDDWAMVLPALPIEGGKMVGQIEDLQARFNINNLVLNGKQQKLYIKRFKRLLRNLQLSEDIASEIIDWIDIDEQVIFSGAEDNEYLNLSPAYRTANQPMQDISELLLIKSVDIKIYEKLLPYVCVLESGTAININTASAEVLTSIAEDITLDDAMSLIKDRDKNVFKDITGFLNHSVLKQKKIIKDGLSVDTQYFQLNSKVQIERINVEYLTILYRDTVGRVMVLNRNRGVL